MSQPNIRCLGFAEPMNISINGCNSLELGRWAQNDLEYSLSSRWGKMSKKSIHKGCKEKMPEQEGSGSPYHLPNIGPTRGSQQT